MRHMRDFTRTTETSVKTVIDNSTCFCDLWLFCMFELSFEIIKVTPVCLDNKRLVPHQRKAI